MNDKLQDAINALRAAGDESGARAVEELRGELARTMEQYHAGQRASYVAGLNAAAHTTPETGDLVGLLNVLLIEVGTSLGDRNHICGRFAEVAEQRGFCVQDLGAAMNEAYAEGRKDEAEERKAGQGVRCREMADEVLGELEGIGTGWNEDDIDRVQGSLLPRVYDLLHLLAIAGGQEVA
jgi:hypothetical protein